MSQLTQLFVLYVCFQDGLCAEIFLCVLQSSYLRWLRPRRHFTWLWSTLAEVSDTITSLICIAKYRFVPISFITSELYSPTKEIINLERVFTPFALVRSCFTTLMFSPPSFSELFLYSSCTQPLFSSFPGTNLFLQRLYFFFFCLRDPLISLPCSLCMLCDLLLTMPNKETSAHQQTCSSDQLSLLHCLTN